MKTLSLPALAVALALACGALAQKPQATPNPCALTAGLEIGMPRAQAFENMRFVAKDLKTQNVKTYHHAPEKRPYTVDVTFASEAPDARVTGLHYVYKPSHVFEALRERYGDPKTRLSPFSWRWELPQCGTAVVYEAKADAKEMLSAEEVKVEPLPKPAK